MPMTISIDEDLKKEFSEVCKEIGLSPSTAFSIFARTVIREHAIPFELSAISLRDRYAQAYDRSVAHGIERGLKQFETKECISREKSQSLRLQETGKAQ